MAVWVAVQTDPDFEQRPAGYLQIVSSDALSPDTMGHSLEVDLGMEMIDFLGYVKRSEQGVAWLNSRNRSASDSVYVIVGAVELYSPQGKPARFNVVEVNK
jgi:hypothetical protein